MYERIKHKVGGGRAVSFFFFLCYIFINMHMGDVHWELIVLTPNRPET